MKEIPHVYQGCRHRNGWTTVLLDGCVLPLFPSLLHRNYGVTVFDWGDKGGASAQLALAMMLEEFGTTLAIRLHQPFKIECVSTFPRDKWTWSSHQIAEWYLDMLWQGRDNGESCVTELEAEQSASDQRLRP